MGSGIGIAGSAILCGNVGAMRPEGNSLTCPLILQVVCEPCPVPSAGLGLALSGRWESDSYNRNGGV